jgi:hypothetical protein
MRTLLRIFGGIISIILGLAGARIGCLVLVGGLYERSIFSIVAVILGIALIAGGAYLVIKAYD